MYTNGFNGQQAIIVLHLHVYMSSLFFLVPAFNAVVSSPGVIMVQSMVNKSEARTRLVVVRRKGKTCALRQTIKKKKRANKYIKHLGFIVNKMGERFKDPSKSFVCTFSNCKASFSKSWKLEAHYCKHTGLVRNKTRVKKSRASL